MAQNAYVSWMGLMILLGLDFILSAEAGPTPLSTLPVNEMEVVAQELETHSGVSDAIACLGLCEAHDWCRSYVYRTAAHSTDAQTCRLQMFANSTRPAANTQSGQLGHSAAVLGLEESKSYFFMTDAGFGGPQHLVVATVTGTSEQMTEACNRLCAADMRCRLWHVDVRDGGCAQFGNANAFNNDAPYFSCAIMRHAYPDSTYPRMNALLVGTDLTTVTPVRNQFVCQALCVGTSGCVGYVWFPATLDCQLKSSIDSVVYQHGPYAGSLTNVSTAVAKQLKEFCTFDLRPDTGFLSTTNEFEPLKTLTKVGRLRCGMECFKDSYCYVFTHNSSSNVCNLYGDLAVTAGDIVTAVDTTMGILK